MKKAKAFPGCRSPQHQKSRGRCSLETNLVKSDALRTRRTRGSAVSNFRSIVHSEMSKAIGASVWTRVASSCDIRRKMATNKSLKADTMDVHSVWSFFDCENISFAPAIFRFFHAFFAEQHALSSRPGLPKPLVCPNPWFAQTAG